MPFLKRNVSAWLFLSGEEKEKVIEYNYFDPETIFITKNIVRANQFKKDNKFRFDHAIADHEVILLFTGRFIKEKGVYDVLEAFEQLIDHYHLKLIMIGDGSEYTALLSRVNHQNLMNKVIFTGFITEKSVVRYYANCDILVFPTYFPEGFPMALFNAVGAGMGVVTTPIRAAKDYLSAPENCIWTVAQDSSSVRVALKTLLDSPPILSEMREQNLAKGLAFSQHLICTELALVVEKLLHKDKL